MARASRAPTGHHSRRALCTAVRMLASSVAARPSCRTGARREQPWRAASRSGRSRPSTLKQSRSSQRATGTDAGLADSRALAGPPCSGSPTRVTPRRARVAASTTAGGGAQLVVAGGQLGQALLLGREDQAPVLLARPGGLARPLEVGADGGARPLPLLLGQAGGLQLLPAVDLLAGDRPGPPLLPLDPLAHLGGGALAADHRLPCRQQRRLGLAAGGPDAAAGAQPGGPAHR